VWRVLGGVWSEARVNSGGRSRARVHSNVQLMDQEVPNHSDDFDYGNIYGTVATLILMTALLQSTRNYGLANYVKKCQYRDYKK
jgi:hypothetical protein